MTFTRSIAGSRHHLAIGALVLAAPLLAPSPAAAQTPAQDSAAGPALTLSPAQRQTIFLSVSRTQKNSAAPTGFRVSVGAEVPAGIALNPLPDTLASLLPQARGYQVAMVEKQVILVDPKTRQVVAVVTGQP
jgi:hypothetical protein